MKNYKLLIVIVLIFGIITCKSQNKKEFENKKYPIEITDNIKKIKDVGWGYRFYIKEAQIIKTYPIKKGIIMAYDGKNMTFFLSKNHFINGNTIPKNSKLRMFAIGKPFAYDLSKPTQIQGYPVGTKKIYGNGSNVDFFEDDGKIKWFMPANNIIIGGIPCIANNSIKLYHSGDLHICTLSKDFDYKGKEYLKNTTIIFDKNRNINPISKNNLGKSHLPWRIKFYDDGNPKEVMLIKNQKVNDIPCKRNSKIFLFPNGKFKECTLYKNIEIDGVQYKKGDKLNFDEFGKIKRQINSTLQ